MTLASAFASRLTVATKKYLYTHIGSVTLLLNHRRLPQYLQWLDLAHPVQSETAKQQVRAYVSDYDGVTRDFPASSTLIIFCRFR
jgi:hypothetical protein